MALSADVLAAAIQAALGQSGPISEKNKDLAKGIVDQVVSSSLVTLPPGTVLGTCPPGGPLAAGSASGGMISALVPDAMAQEIAAGDGGPDKKIIDLAKAICTHIQTAVVVFAPGTIIGACTNTPTTPGPFVGTASGGKITGLSGDALAQLIAPDQGGTVSPQLKAMAGAITDHVQSAGEAVFASGVTGVAPMGGGPLTAGAGVGGKIL